LQIDNDITKEGRVRTGVVYPDLAEDLDYLIAN
jgi:hypothetical protein